MKFSKEELLAKGIDPIVADEIIASYDRTDDGTPLSKLEKALKPKKKNDEQSLFKAEKGEKEGDAEDDAEPDDDEDDKEKFMKKNKKAMKKAEEEDEDEEDEKEMKKAFDSIDRTAPGAVVEMEDLAPSLSAIHKSFSSLLKAVNDLSNRVDTIVSQNEESYSLMHKAAELQVETSKGLSSVLSIPAGRKGVTASVNMEKAQGINTDLANRALVYQVLAKAVKLKDPIGGAIAERYESAGHDIRALSKDDRAGIAKLIQENNK
jgi:hypothetical protein